MNACAKIQVLYYQAHKSEKKNTTDVKRHTFLKIKKYGIFIALNIPIITHLYNNTFPTQNNLIKLRLKTKNTAQFFIFTSLLWKN